MRNKRKHQIRIRWTCEDLSTDFWVHSNPFGCKTVERICLHFIYSFKMHFKTRNSSFIFRIVEYFVGFFQPLFMAVFLWSSITICGAMLMIQIEIVQCSNLLYTYRSFQWKYIPFSFSFSDQSREWYTDVDCDGNWGILFIYCDFHHMRNGRTAQE